MKIKEQTIKALDELTEADLMLVNEWINQLRSSHHSVKPRGKYEINYERDWGLRYCSYWVVGLLKRWWGLAFQGLKAYHTIYGSHK